PLVNLLKRPGVINPRDKISYDFHPPKLSRGLTGVKGIPYLPKMLTAVMAGLVPAIHAAKLLPLLRKRLRMRGFSSCEAAAGRRADDCYAIALRWPGQARP
ncbi:MAG: hypothetical protein ABR878_05320, partial [Roseiarcus sp.]